MEDTQFKSPLFDATATWNGFSYQGKVGLYVCLKLINDALLRNENIDELCAQYCIEFEWLEDFSILQNNQYISHHQVKHYNDDKFSSYIDAIVTILSRQQGRISENDLYKYIVYYAQVNTESFNKKEYIEKLIDRLIEGGIVNESRFVIVNEVSSIDGFNDDVVIAVNNYLDDFITIKKQYLNGCVYVHTSKKVKVPNQDLSDYKGIKKSKVCLKHASKRTLTSENVICSFDSNSEYELAFDDAELTGKLIHLAESILQHQNPTLVITPEILTIYVASIKDLIDKYVAQRHEDLNRDESIKLSEKVKRKLPFANILDCLKKEIIDESSDYYWELICRENFENAFQKQIDFLDEENLVERRNLYRHYQTTKDKYIKQGKLALLLKALKPHLPVCHNSSKSNYYHQHIASESDISRAYLSFLENLNIEHDDCFFFPKNGQHYYASTISVNRSNPRHAKKAIETLKIDFKERYIYLDKGTDFIVIDSPNSTKFSGRLEKFVEVPNVLGYEVTDKKHITSTKELTFVHYELAQEKLNE